MKLRIWKVNYQLQLYIRRVLTVTSIFINVLLGGQINQTLSARNYELMRNGKPNWVWLIDRIFWFHKDHCHKSWMYWASGLEGQSELRKQKNQNKEEQRLKNITKLL